MQSKIALGSGGISGKGYLEGTQSHLNFLPEMRTDFIFTMLAEEFGMIGGLALLGLMVTYLLNEPLNDTKRRPKNATVNLGSLPLSWIPTRRNEPKERL